jgi:hypothetical protein
LVVRGNHIVLPEKANFFVLLILSHHVVYLGLFSIKDGG